MKCQNHLMRTFFCITVAATVLAGACFLSGCGQQESKNSSSTKEAWPIFSFTTKSGLRLFSARMPDLPSPLYTEQTTTLSGNVQATLYESFFRNQSNREFKITHITYPSSFTTNLSPEKILNDNLLSFQKNLTQSSLKSSSLTTVAENKAVDFVLEQENKTIYGRIIFSASQNTLYTLTLSSLTGTSSDQEWNQFIESFEINK